MGLRTVGKWKNLSEHWSKVVAKCQGTPDPQTATHPTSSSPTGEPYPISPGSASPQWVSWHQRRLGLDKAPMNDDAEPDGEPTPGAEAEAETSEKIDAELLLMRKYFAKWAHHSGVHASVCDALHDGEFMVDWTRVISPALEGRIKMVS